jgi:putative ABC transport system substrate-binding protein
MRRRAFIMLAAGAAAAWPLAARAQQQGKIHRIGILALSSAAASQHQWHGFRERLRDLGYVEGENIAFERRSADGKIDRLPGLAAELVRLRVDILVAGTTQAALAAKDATKTIPIVFRAVSDPIRVGLIPSLARPGGNITGTTNQSLDLAGKRLELLKEIAPAVSRFASLWEQTHIIYEFQASETEVAARALGVPMHAVAVRNASELVEAFAAMRGKGADALLVLPSAMFLHERKRLADLALKSKLPTVFPQRDYVEAGGLMSYGENFVDEARRAAVYVAKILKGANPADLPVEQPTKFELIINLRTAKTLGLVIPESFLLRADEVIE